MHKCNAIARFLLIGLVIFGSGTMMGCTKKPNNNDISKLEESRSAAEGAERKLADLRQERMKLEQELQAKQGELQSNEKERDDLKSKVK
jgi:chromosome segregation ATPase